MRLHSFKLEKLERLAISMEPSPFLEYHCRPSGKKNLLPVMESDGSLPSIEESTTDPCPNARPLDKYCNSQIFLRYHESGGSRFFRNTGTHLPHYAASHPRRS
jgi:hypothetical protein